MPKRVQITNKDLVLLDDEYPDTAEVSVTTVPATPAVPKFTGISDAYFTAGRSSVVVQAGIGHGGFDAARFPTMDRRFGQTGRELVNTAAMTVRNADGSLTLSGRPLATPERMSDGRFARYEVGGVWTRGQSNLRIPQYHSGRLVCSIPHGYGIWPAPMWLTDRHGGGECEFDVHEGFHAEDGFVGKSTLFCDTDPGASYSKRVQQVRGKVPLADPAEPSSLSSTVCLDWRIDREGGGVRFRTWFNGILVMSRLQTDRLRWLGNNDPADAWDLLMNLQITGDWCGDPYGALGYLPGPRRVYDPAGLRRYGHAAGTEHAGEKKLGPVWPVQDFRLYYLEIAA